MGDQAVRAKDVSSLEQVGCTRCFAAEAKKIFKMIPLVAADRTALKIRRYPGTVSQARKKEHRSKLLSPDIFRWGRGLPCEGMRAKKFGMPLETREIRLLGRDIPGFCWDIPAVPEKSEKKKLVFKFWPLLCTAPSGESPSFRCGFPFKSPTNRAIASKLF